MENKKEVLVCRCCLELITDDRVVILTSTEKHMLEFLFPSMQLNICHGSKLCQECLEDMQSSYTFKDICIENIHREKFIKHENCSADMPEKNILIKEENNSKCPLCYETDSGQLSILERDAFLQIMLEKCLPELDDSFAATAVCEKCVASLKRLSSFFNTCVNTEEYLKSYQSVSDSTANLSLYEVYKLKNSVLKNNIFDRVVDPVKTEDNSSFVKVEPKTEDCEEFLCESVLHTEKVEFDQDKEPQSAQDGHSSRQQDIKEDIKDHILCSDATSDTSSVPDNQISSLTCEICSFLAKTKRGLQRHITAHANSSQTTVLHCCKICTFKTVYKASLANHVLLHQSVPETEMYKCDECAFQTRHKSSIKCHALTHKKTSELIMHKCKMCHFETKRKKHLKLHSLSHKNPAEIATYKCAECPYTTIYKRYLNGHLQTHRKMTEMKTFKCEDCTYVTESKASLYQHKLVHHNSSLPSDVTRFKCKKCPYETVIRKCFIGHLITHKDPSELVMYKCETCGHQTKYKKGIKRHMLTHARASELTMHECQICAHRTRHKGNLEKHMLTHHSASEIKKHKCELCTYKAKHKGNFKRHMLTHTKV